MHVSKRTALAAAGVAVVAFAVPALADQHSPAGGTGGQVACNDGQITWTPDNLWPPNHKMIPVTITYTDTDGDSNTATPATTETTSVSVGTVTETDGSTTNNALVGDDLNGSGAPGSVQGPDATTDTDHPATMGSDPSPGATWTEDLRAERSGTDGHGGQRVYDLSVTCSDMGGTDPMESGGKMQTVDIQVTVPHDQGVVKP
jgi:hypothetical protein